MQNSNCSQGAFCHSHSALIPKAVLKSSTVKTRGHVKVDVTKRMVLRANLPCKPGTG